MLVAKKIVRTKYLQRTQNVRFTLEGNYKVGEDKIKINKKEKHLRTSIDDSIPSNQQIIKGM